VRVKDNGPGIAASSLSKVAQRYFTSKRHDPASFTGFGFRGEALASMAEIASLEVYSRQLNDATMNTLQLRVRDRERLMSASNTSRAAPSSTADRRTAPDLWTPSAPPSKSGTSSTNGQCGSWRLAIPALADLIERRKTAGATIEQIRKMIETYALSHPGIAFTLEDAEKKDSKVMTLLRVKSVPERWASIFGGSFTKVGPIPIRDYADLWPVSHRHRCAVRRRPSRRLHLLCCCLQQAVSVHQSVAFDASRAAKNVA
jgi:DNA mismatch repair protein MLH3